MYAAYFPWVSLTITMLDSYADWRDDAASDDHSYISHYVSEAAAAGASGRDHRRAASRAARLPNGHRHAVIVACMVAMYLSRAGANTPSMRERTRTLARAGGHAHAAAAAESPACGAPPGRARPRSGDDRRASSRPASPLPAAAADLSDLALAAGVPANGAAVATAAASRSRMTSYPPLVFLSDPDDIKAMLAAPAESCIRGRAERRQADRRRGSFMLLDEEEHLNGRKIVLPALQRSAIDREHEAGARRRAAGGLLVAPRRLRRAASAPARADAGGHPAAGSSAGGSMAGGAPAHAARAGARRCCR